MNFSVIGQNIKKLREEQGLTQQQLADKLYISFQAVSKWENGQSMPEITLLPAIADIFAVPIDALFQPRLVPYRNKAARLTALYEKEIENSERFHQADREFRNLFDTGNFSEEDLGQYAYLLECHARYYLGAAEEYYRRSIEEGRKQKGDAYYKNQRQYLLFLSRLGRSKESAEKYSGLLSQEPNNPKYYPLLILAYQSMGELQKAAETADKGLARFPEDALLLIYAGNVYKQQCDFERAVACWKKAYQIDGEMIDAEYALAAYYLENQWLKQAEQALHEIISWNTKRGYEIENAWAQKELQKLQQAKQG